MNHKPNRNSIRLRSIFGITLAAVATLGLVSCGNGNGSKGAKKEMVTVSIPPIKYLVDRISGNELDVNVMVATGACQETYEPTPTQMKDVAKSSIFFGISNLEFEQKWLQNIKANNAKLSYKNLAEGIYEEPEACTHTEAEHEHGHHHSHGGVDPHFWLSPKNYKAMAQAAYNELVRLFPSNKEAYTRNYNALTASIDSVDAAAKSKLINLTNKKFIIYHPALSYFAKEYGMEQISIEKDGKEPDANHIKELVTIAKTNGIKKIFVQKEFDMSIIKSFAGEIGATVEPINTFAYDWVGNMNQIIETLYSANR